LILTDVSSVLRTCQKIGRSTTTAEVNNKSNISTPTASITGVDAVALQGDKKRVRLRTVRGKQLLY
jgi:hypothetical protein